MAFITAIYHALHQAQLKPLNVYTVTPLIGQTCAFRSAVGNRRSTTT